MVSLPPEPKPIRVETLQSLTPEEQANFGVLQHVAAYFIQKCGEPLWEKFVEDFPRHYDEKADLSDPAFKSVFMSALKTGFFNAITFRLNDTTKT
jgi:hypothetical protein